MSDNIKVVRLSKAAREFNIALDTVVDFLSNKGFDVIKSPNTKLDPEMYAILQNEFQDEKEVKKASRERNLEFLGQGPITIGTNKVKRPKNLQLKRKFLKNFSLPALVLVKRQMSLALKLKKKLFLRRKI